MAQTHSVQKTEAQAPQGVERLSPQKVFMPRADIHETKDSLLVLADMPGVDEKSIDITIEKNILTIYGKVEPWKPEGCTLTYAEYEIGDFQRAFTISDEIDRDNIQAAVKNGVLHLTLPKSGKAKARKIEVKAIN